MNKQVVILLLIGLSVRVNAQLPLKTVVQRYETFKSELPRPRLHFVFNQDKYAPGDTIFFKAYFSREGRQLIDVTLLGPGRKTIHHTLFAVNKGVGANQIILPDTLQAGIYMFAAYSSWAKNYGSPPVFTKEITVAGERSVVKEAPAPNPMQLTVTNDRTVTITSPEGSLLRHQTMYLLVVNNDKIVSARSFTQGIRDRASIDLHSSLPTGMNVLYVIDKIGRQVGTGSCFVPGPNPVTVSFEATGPLQTRRKANIALSLKDENDKPVEGEFSVRVFNGVTTDSVRMSFGQDLALSFPVNEPWHQILYERNHHPGYNFTTDLSKKGTVYMADGVTPVPAPTRVFFYMQENDVMIQSLTTKGGKIRLLVPDFYGTDNLFYIAEYSGEEIPGAKIVWDDQPIELPSPPSFKEVNEGDPYGIFAANKRMIDKAFDYDGTASPEKPKEVERNESELENRLSGADITIRVDDYVSFATMEEMIREIVPALKVRKVKGKEIVQMGLQRGIPESEPLYIIDGIATKDTPFFLSLRPVDLLTLKLVTNPGKLATLGLMSRSGIVIVETRSGNAHLPFDRPRFVEGISRPLEFKQAHHNDTRRPDFRSAIYWNPTVKTDANGNAVVEFECSDDLGPVYIRVDGFTADGRPFSGERKLKFILTEK